MSEMEIITMIKWTGGAIGTILAIIFGMVMNKVDKSDFKDHCERQSKVNDKFDNTIKDNNDLLIRVDQKLKDLK